jgi:hypothetical protein
MATRRGPGEPVDPFDTLPLGQTLSGERERARDEARRALDASLGRSRVDVLSERAQTVLSEIQETPTEAQRSADLAAMQRRLAADAEEARQRSLRDAAQRARREVEEAQARREREQARREQALRDAARFEDDVSERNRQRAGRAATAMGEVQALQGNAVAVDERVRTLVSLESRIQRNIDAVQRTLTTLAEDLTHVREQLAKKTPAPTGNEEAPFCEGERHLDLGEDK